MTYGQCNNTAQHSTAGGAQWNTTCTNITTAGTLRAGKYELAQKQIVR
jgi:hypothetical protein